jgi:hypothetical protein
MKQTHSFGRKNQSINQSRVSPCVALDPWSLVLGLRCFVGNFSSFFFWSRFLRFFAGVAIFRYGASRSDFATQSSAVSVRNAKKNVGKEKRKLCCGIQAVFLLTSRSIFGHWFSVLVVLLRFLPRFSFALGSCGSLDDGFPFRHVTSRSDFARYVIHVCLVTQ